MEIKDIKFRTNDNLAKFAKNSQLYKISDIFPIFPEFNNITYYVKYNYTI